MSDFPDNRTPEWRPYPPPRRAARRVPWYRRTWVVVLGLLLFFPFGLVVLWMRADWSVVRRTWVSAGTAAFVVVVVVTGSHGNGPGTGNAGAVALSGSSPSSTASSTTAAHTPAATSPAAASSAPASSPATSRSITTAPTTHAAEALTHEATSRHTVVAAPTSTEAHVVETTAPPVTTSRAPSLCGAPANPYGYNFCGGGLIYSPASDICSYFSCIDNFWNGKGYMVECSDGMYSMSGGRSGACSYHGGENRPVYS